MNGGGLVMDVVKVYIYYVVEFGVVVWIVKIIGLVIKNVGMIKVFFVCMFLLGCVGLLYVGVGVVFV